MLCGLQDMLCSPEDWNQGQPPTGPTEEDYANDTEEEEEDLGIDKSDEENHSINTSGDIEERLAFEARDAYMALLENQEQGPEVDGEEDNTSADNNKEEDNASVDKSTPSDVHQSLFNLPFGSEDLSSKLAEVISSGRCEDWQYKSLQLIHDCMGLFELKGRERGSISGAQKMKSLNSRWFGPRKRNLEKEEGSRLFEIERDVIVTVQMSDTESDQKKEYFVVMAVFSKHYKKWSMTTDKPMWAPNMKKSNYKLFLRKVEYSTSFEKYCLVSVSNEHPAASVFRRVDLNQITSVVVKIQK